MFSYYGGKSKIIKKYSPPRYNTIIEPFCGSARYALLYNDKNVILNDSYEVVANIWNYLVNATPDKIKNLPSMKRGDDIRDLDLPRVEKDLLGFMVNRGVPYPHNIYTTWTSEGNEIEKVKSRILQYLPKIKHWIISCESYESLPNIEATWFIDPPYQYGGERYIENNIDYTKLGEWCKSRKGQVIVCENSKADWLPFSPLVELHGQRHKTMESVWLK